MASDEADRRALAAIRSAQRLRGERQVKRQRAQEIADRTRVLLEVGMLIERFRKLRESRRD
jgi:hypothetical protein